MKGYTGKILVVDLKDRSSKIVNIEDSIYESFLSGAGLGAWYLYKNIPANADALSENNILGFVSGLLTGVGAMMTGRFMVMCKSPLTGGIGEANCGGYMAPVIKQCGYDAIFIHNKSDELVYLYVDSKGAEVIDAKEFKGVDTTSCEESLIERHSKNGKIPAVATIGISGEKLSLISGICNDKGRIAARSGVGAVMGSKNLKAVVCQGTKPISGLKPDEIKKHSKDLSKSLRGANFPSIVRPHLFSAMKFMPPFVVPLNGILSAMIMKKWGTAGSFSMCMATGDGPIKNWGGSVKEFGSSKYRKIDGGKMLKNQIRKYHCYSCPLGCGAECDINKATCGEYKVTHKPEYETQNAYGGLLMNDDLDSLYYINELLNRAGMDTISAGHCVAMAIECYQNNLITLEDLNGIDLGWGKSKEIIEFTKLMVERKGIGDIFADGTKLAAERLGKGYEYAVHAGGQEAGMHDGRGDPPLAIHYAVDATPGRHTTGSSQYYSIAHLWKKVSWAPVQNVMPKSREYIPSEEETAKAVAMAFYKRILDGVGGCFFGVLLGVENYRLFEWLNSTTGWNLSPDEYMEIGKRIYTIRQLFNIKHGIDPWSYNLHSRLKGDPPLDKGPLKGKTVPIEEMMRLFWNYCGWDSDTGIPKQDTVEALNLASL